MPTLRETILSALFARLSVTCRSCGSRSRAPAGCRRPSPGRSAVRPSSARLCTACLT